MHMTYDIKIQRSRRVIDRLATDVSGSDPGRSDNGAAFARGVNDIVSTTPTLREFLSISCAGY